MTTNFSFLKLLPIAISIPLLLVLLLSAPGAIHAFSASGSTTTVSNGHVVFVSGLSESCTADKLVKEFSRYGEVIDISTVGLPEEEECNNPVVEKRQKNPYAFVRFQSPQSAQSAIDNSQGGGASSASSLLYQQVKHAKPKDSSKRKRSNASRQTQDTEYKRMIDMCSKTNLVLQVQSTHVDRLIEYLTNCLPAGIRLKIEGCSSAVTRNISLVLISTPDPTLLANELGETSHLQVLARAVIKLYVVQPGALQVDLGKEAGCEMAVNDLIRNKMSKHSSTDDDKEGGSVRLQIFPASRQSKVIAMIEEMDANLATKLTPRDATDVMSIVQVYTYRGRKSESNSNALVMSGVSKSTNHYSNLREAFNNDQEAVSRAYYKIKEAVERYSLEHVDFSMDLFRNSNAIDCGSAPGGWTKYLAQDLKCNLVHSIDPGELEIDTLGNVNHMQMKFEDAMPILKQKTDEGGDEKMGIFVSDACLHTMSAQVDFLIDAKDQGILLSDDEGGVFFVLTLKCTKGYGKAAFDAQTESVVCDLNERATIRDLSVYHLFSNRSGERTIIGTLI